MCVCMHHLLYVLIMVLRGRSGLWKEESVCEWCLRVCRGIVTLWSISLLSCLQAGKLHIRTACWGDLASVIESVSWAFGREAEAELTIFVVSAEFVVQWGGGLGGTRRPGNNSCLSREWWVLWSLQFHIITLYEKTQLAATQPDK